MNQLLVKFKLPENGKLYASAFKELVARECRNHPLAPESLFHFKQGRPITNAEPDVTFVGGQRWVGLLSRSGDKGTLLPLVGVISQILGEHFNQPIASQVESLAFDIERTNQPIQYYFRDVVYRRGDRWKGSCEALIARQLVSKIRTERDRLRLDLPQSRDFALPPHEYEAADQEALIKELGIHVFDTRTLAMRLITKEGPTKRFVQLRSGILVMNAKVSGMLQFGSLQSRGYGRLILAAGAQS